LETGTKLLTYITRRLITVFLIIIILLMSTFIAYDCANIYVILEEGMSMRAESVLTDNEVSSLEHFFTQHFLSTDELLQNNKYGEYIITDYDYKIKIKKVWAWPWSTRANATIQEIVSDISGDMRITEDELDELDAEDELDENENANNGESSVPEWENGEKLVRLKKVNGRWLIDEVILERPLEKFE